MSDIIKFEDAYFRKSEIQGISVWYDNSFVVIRASIIVSGKAHEILVRKWNSKTEDDLDKVKEEILISLHDRIFGKKGRNII